MGRVTWVCRHWPLASSSRAGSPYPRHLARALDFPGSAHPRQERGGARLAQNRVTAPGDDAGYVDPKGDHQVGDQDSFPPKAGHRASFTIPVWEWPEPARHGASAPCLGAAWVLYNNQTLMTAFPFRSCWAPHGGLGSLFSFALSALKACPVLPSWQDNSGVAPRLHAEGPSATTAALRVPASEDGRVARVARRVQGPAISASTPGACGRRLSESIPGSR